MKINTILECFANISNRHDQIQYITCSSFNITRLLMKFPYNITPCVFRTVQYPHVVQQSNIESHLTKACHARFEICECINVIYDNS